MKEISNPRFLKHAFNHFQALEDNIKNKVVVKEASPIWTFQIENIVQEHGGISKVERIKVDTTLLEDIIQIGKVLNISVTSNQELDEINLPSHSF